MRLRKGKVLSLAAILFGGLLVILAFQARKPTLKLNDGTILRLEKIDYGKKQPFRLDTWRDRFQWVIDRLPAWLYRYLPAKYLPGLGGQASWEGGQLPMPGEDAIYAWLTRFNPHSVRHVDTGLHWAEIVDEHGCRFIAAQSGGTTRHQGAGVRGYEVGWFAFQAFPRRQKQFRLRLYDFQQKFVGEFVVHNPARSSPANWEAGPLPVTKRDGNLAVTLNSLSLLPDSNGSGTDADGLQPPPLIVPTFEISEGGRPTKEWQAVEMELFDSTGNSPSHWPLKSLFLCPFEPAWKLRAKFCGSENSRSASNTCWTLRRLNLPSSGSFTALALTQQVQGVTLHLIGLAGAGYTSYSNDVPVRAQVLSGLEKEDYTESSKGSGSGVSWSWVNDVQMRIPHVALHLVSGLTEDQRLSVQAIDDKGRKFFATAWEWDFKSGGFKESSGPYLRLNYASLYFMGLDAPADVSELDLTFCVHRVRTVEFTVKPPGRSP